MEQLPAVRCHLLAHRLHLPSYRRQVMEGRQGERQHSLLSRREARRRRAKHPRSDAHRPPRRVLGVRTQRIVLKGRESGSVKFTTVSDCTCPSYRERRFGLCTQYWLFFRLNLKSVYESRYRDGIREAVRPVVVIFFFFC
ncbi:hypothetical protein BU25DRAFT_234746 [Macroventuria anomochaeta]|uniref:Uncharacterized protein n=1 Tax=Macroventuria anomochaeta TaxID=301207 RepID=A0ACB6RJR3_9PLEO|nr:uncharacterized protein BU25DRAFT_234746 [Macroventuria anomochaeta]KAF2621582.1 hypothetical protein BU25DRAFT_234746 [Macroventuria anomochaeta]